MQTSLFALVTCIAILSIAILVWIARREPVDVDDMPPPVFVTVPPTTTAAPTTTPAPEIENIRVHGITIAYPRVAPLLEMRYRPQRWEFVPGAVVPGVDGLRVEEATRLILTTYPGIITRIVDHSENPGLEVRRDRITLSIDPYVKRVVRAQVG
jgi:hypothetical protein